MSRTRGTKRAKASGRAGESSGEAADGDQAEPAAEERVLPGSAARREPGARAVSIHAYLPQCVVIGSIYMALPQVVEYLNVAGAYLHLHKLMWVPYRESGEAIVRRDGVVGKHELLFVVDRSEAAPPRDGEDGWQVVDVATGPFLIRGRANFDTIGTLSALAASRDRFLVLRDARIDGPLGAAFTEPYVILNVDRAGLIAAG